MIRTQQKVLQVAARTILEQKVNILKTISQKDYVLFHEDRFKATVGGHMRHSLDHYSALLSHDFSGEVIPVIDYDVRDRQTDVETNRESALGKTTEMIARLADLFDSSPQLLSSPLTVRFIGDAVTGETYNVPTSLAREVSFVAHHGIHHLGNYMST